jgi:hypothetical protein
VPRFNVSISGLKIYVTVHTCKEKISDKSKYILNECDYYHDFAGAITEKRR